MKIIKVIDAWKIFMDLFSSIEEEGGLPIAITLADIFGLPLLHIRMERAPSRLSHFSMNKAYTAAFRESSTLDLKMFLQREGVELASFGNPRLCALPGGVPIWHDGGCIGALAVSGRAPMEDHALALDLVEKLKEVL